MQFFEDLEVGKPLRFGQRAVLREEVIDFAAKFDPQPFHLRVRPAIVDIVSETWLQRLDQHNRDDDEAGDADADAEATEDHDAAA